MTREVVVFTTPGCTSCERTKALLNARLSGTLGLAAEGA